MFPKSDYSKGLRRCVIPSQTTIYYRVTKNSIHECTPKSKNFVKFEANGFFDPELSLDNEDSKKIWVCDRWFCDSKKFYTRLLHTPSNEEVVEIGLFGVGSFIYFKKLNTWFEPKHKHPRKCKR